MGIAGFFAPRANDLRSLHGRLGTHAEPHEEIQMNHPRAIWVAATAVLSAVGSLRADPFTYQGQLKNNGQPVSANYDFQFTLYDAASGGAVIAGPVPAN